MNEPLLRDLVPAVIGVLSRCGADFAAAEDAMQDALVEAVRVWPDDPPRRPRRFYCGGDGNSVGVQYADHADLAAVGPAGLLGRR